MGFVGVKEDGRRTELTEVFYIGVNDVTIELLAVFYGEENGVQLPYGPCREDQLESGVEGE